MWVNYGKRETNSLSSFKMRSQTLLIIRWKLTGKMEAYVNLGKLYTTYSSSHLGVSRYTLDRKNLFEGFQNEIVEIIKVYIK
jgi:hypothetical protein